MEEIVKEKTLFRKSAPFVKVLITPQKNVSKGSDRKYKKLVQMVIGKTGKRNVNIGENIYVDLKITKLQNFWSHQNRMRNGKSKYILMKNVNRTCDNSKNNTVQNIYASMVRMSGNDEFTGENVGHSSQLTNWILDSGATYHMTQEVSDVITGTLEEANKHIEVADGHHV